ncbi:FecCD family ABC transporter permease [Xanthobacter sp. TB0136]|uniref:FecCD family ABC transporter permease n=1 Tax=Xanthobacter sp. TB0136 TaxID=3459177 RepID=UPI00403A181B
MRADTLAGAGLRADILCAHDKVRLWRILALVALVILLLAGLLADLLTGPAGLSLGQIRAGLMGEGDEALAIIMWQVRLPTAMLAILIGASLSLAGAEMQTILHNPLASPFTLGVSSAASFGAALAIIVGVSLPWMPADMAVPVNAFLFAFGAVLLIQLVAATQGHAAGGATTLVLFGIALVFGFNALVAVLQFIAPADSLQQLIFWTMGSLSRADSTSVLGMGLVLAVVLPFSLRATWSLTLLSLGEERARSLGVNIALLRFGCLLRASLLAAVAVAFAGSIGFVGLVGPHMARLMVGEDHRFFLPAALLSGAVLLSFANVASKLIVPGVVLPIGIVTSLVGLPCFLALLFWGRGRR